MIYNTSILFLSHPFTADKEANRQDASMITQQLQQQFPQSIIYNPVAMYGQWRGYSEDSILTFCFGDIQKSTLLLQCDGWEKSPGCRAEVAFARFMGIPFMPLNDFLRMAAEVHIS